MKQRSSVWRRRRLGGNAGGRQREESAARCLCVHRIGEEATGRHPARAAHVHGAGDINTAMSCAQQPQGTRLQRGHRGMEDVRGASSCCRGAAGLQAVTPAAGLSSRERVCGLHPVLLYIVLFCTSRESVTDPPHASSGRKSAALPRSRALLRASAMRRAQHHRDHSEICASATESYEYQYVRIECHRAYLAFGTDQSKSASSRR